jgi:GalNAc-alpha-(1->4)-GalNAc-alpha-(1->3)-diNAcBac-PP-undecaprenol alpha-1,4-N-acetyl-D-galactosaminyltransferase
VSKSIAIVTGSLRAGGSSPLVLTFVRWFCDRNWKVYLIVLSPETTNFFDPPQGAKVFYLEQPKANYDLVGQFKRHLRLRKIITRLQPDIVFSVIWDANLHTLLALIFSKVRVVVSEHTDLRYLRLPLHLRILRSVLYPMASCVTLVTANCLEFVSKKFPKWKTIVMTNPFTPAPLGSSDLKFELKKPFVLAAGRLSYEKGFDLLIRAFSKIADLYPDWNIYIFGEGPEKENLEKLISSLNLTHRIYLKGVTPYIGSVLLQADIFCLSSRREGQPVVLGEAMLAAKAIVSFDCPSGPSKMLQHKISGLLVPPNDIEQLAANLSELMSNHDLRNVLGRLAAESAKQFLPETVMPNWETLFLGIISKNARTSK